MVEESGAAQYNYERFSMEAHESLNSFGDAPQPGDRGPDFPLWWLEGEGQTSLHQVCGEHRFTVVEFGSIT